MGIFRVVVAAIGDLFRVLDYRVCRLLSGLVVVSFAACGGGGAPEVAVPMFSSMPNAVTLAASEVASYNVGGGTLPYTAISSNAAVATASVSGKTVTITGKSMGSVNITVFDAAGKSVGTVATVGSNPAAVPLYVTAPDEVTIALGGAGNYTIGGGTGPYRAGSGDQSVAGTTVTGSALVIDGKATGKTSVTVTDALGAAKLIAITVGSGNAAAPLFMNLPSVVSLSLGAPNSYVVGGGTPPYSVSSSAPAVTRTSLSGSSLTVEGLSAGSSIVQVTDATGTKVSANVSVGSPLTMDAPSQLTVATGMTASFAISGGTPPYRVSSGNPTAATGVVNGTNLAVSGVAAGIALITVRDANNASVTTNTTVVAAGAGTLYITAPLAVTINTGATATYSIGGGAPPYRVTTANNTFATATVSGGNTLTVSGLTAGTTDIVIYDDQGRSAFTRATIGSGSGLTTLFMTAPGAVTVAPGSSAAYLIGGGIPPYATSSSNPAAVTATVSGTGLTVTGVGAAGTAQVSVYDATGAQVATTVTVSSSASTDNLYVTAPLAISIDVGETVNYSIGGGTAPYRVSTSRAAVATATVSGSTLTIVGAAAGTAQVMVFDATGRSVFTTATVGANAESTSLFVTAPSAVTLAAATTQTYTVGGGTAPYYASSSVNGVATAVVTGTSLVMSAVANGVAQVNVVDSTGAVVRVTVNVGSGSAALHVTAPSAIAVAVGASTNLTAGGGTPPYRVGTGNTGVATTSITGDVLTISGIAAGSTQVVVVDSTGQSVTLSVTVGSSTATTLFVTAPSAVSMVVGTAPTYTIGGGTAPYTVSSSNVAVAVGNLIGGNTLNVAAVSPGSAQVVVFDANGNSTTITVTVVSASSALLFTTAPSSVTVNTGGTRDYDIGGGVGPYRAVSDNQSVVTATVTGQTLTIAGVTGGRATVTVRDAANTTVTISVTVGSGTALFTSAHTSVSLAVGATPTYTIGGGAAPYVASSSNASVATVAVSSGTLLTVTGLTTGTAVVNVLDSTGSIVSINVTVGSGGGGSALFTTAPSPLTVGTGAVSTYLVSGGTGPYSANSSNPAVATSSVSGGTLTINSVANGLANIVVTDSLGARVTIEITVTATATTPLLVSPSAASANVGDILNFSVSGASPPYNISVNNVSVACVSGTASSCSSGGTTSVGATGGSFYATMLNVGATTVAITDSLGQTSTLNLTVNATATTLRLSPSALMVGEDEVRTIALNVYGGTAPYTAYTSDLVLSNASVTGNVFSTGLGSRGSRCINPVDASLEYIVNGTFDVTLTVVDSLGASATSTLTIKDNGKGLSLAPNVCSP